MLVIFWRRLCKSRYLKTTSKQPKIRINPDERIKRINEGVENLRRIVPGVDRDKADKATVLQLTAAYVKFIKKTFGSDHHSEFLSENNV